jgi:hypothetical protein
VPGESSHTAAEDVRPHPDAPGGGVSRLEHVHGHEHLSLEDPHVHDADDRSHHVHEDRSHHHDDEPHGHVEAVPPTAPSRAVVINVGEHTGALVLASNQERSGLEVEIHPVAQPEARTHVWVLPREGRDGVVFAAVFPSLASGDYAILDLDKSVARVVSVPANQVTHATWL